jgi:DNA/RNA-binding domain of Phe-tRNA-synthetase-like protein
MPLTIVVEPHPLLEVGAFVTRFSQPLGTVSMAPSGATPPLAAGGQVKPAVRDLLRHGGYKPSGRSKPASEYLAAAAVDGRFPAINPAVDVCNIVSLHSGLPISVVDVDKLDLGGPLAIKVAPPGTTYVFNPSGQVIDASGLLALYDAQGPTGTPVKDAQRTKTDDTTRAVLSVVWGTSALPGRTRETVRWYRELVGAIAGAVVEDVLTR